MDRETFVGMFASLSEAIEFENAALSAGDDYLPEFVQIVRDGEEPVMEYWQWLYAQRSGS
jgi:hypothetical protein